MWNIDVTLVEKWLGKLPKEQKFAIAKKIALLEKLGDKLAMPNVRTLGAGLYELREMSFGIRVYFYFSRETQKIIVVVAGGNKDSQQRDIKIAREAMR